MGLGEGALEELMLMEMLVVDGAGMDVVVIPRPDIRGGEAASGFLEGELVFSIGLAVLIKRKQEKDIKLFCCVSEPLNV